MSHFAFVFGAIGRLHAFDALHMSYFAFVFGMIGRLHAIELALHYDLRAAKAERENVVVPVEVWAAMTNAWNLAKGRAPIYPMQPIAVQQ